MTTSKNDDLYPSRVTTVLVQKEDGVWYGCVATGKLFQRRREFKEKKPETCDSGLPTKSTDELDRSSSCNEVHHHRDERKDQEEVNKET